MSDAPDLVAVISSVSRTLPLGDAWSITGAFGYSRRNLFAGYRVSHSNTCLDDAALPDFLPEVLRSPGSGSALRRAGGPAPPQLADAVHPRLRRGPRGLPGQLISGDSGWLSTGDGLYAKVQYRS